MYRTSKQIDMYNRFLEKHKRIGYGVIDMTGTTLIINFGNQTQTRCLTATVKSLLS